MRIGSKTATVVLTLASGLCALGAGSAPALGSAGGASAPGSPTRTSAANKAVAHVTGLATWFGPGFYGKKTACGQTLTPSVVGVANRTLPCGTLIKVAYAGRAVTVPVLDRGPYSRVGAEWDLTAGAARALGITETVRIRTRIVGQTANSPMLGLPAMLPPSEVISGGAVAG